MKSRRQLHLEASIIVDRQLEAFPSELNDPRSLLCWDRSVAAVEVTSSGPLHVGSTFTTIGPRRRHRPGVRTDYRVLALQPKHNRVEVIRHPLFTHATWTFEYAPAAAATRITCAVDATLKRRWTFLRPLLQGARDSLGADLMALKDYVEQGESWQGVRQQ